MLDVRRLRLLRELHHRGTVGAVADALGYTPSAVSQGLAQLEREAGVALLERFGRRVRLTDAARTLVSHADTILVALERAESELAGPAGVRGTVRIAAFQTAAQALVTPALAALDREHPALACSLAECEAEESLPGLRLGEFDVAVAEEYRHAPRPRDPTLDRHPLRDDPLVVALARSHPLAGGDSAVGLAAGGASPLPLAALAGERWATAREGTAYAGMVVGACRALGEFDPQIRHRVNDMGTLLALAAGGLAVAIVPALGVPADHPDVAIRPIEGGLSRHIFAAVRRGSGEHPAIRTVLAALAG